MFFNNINSIVIIAKCINYVLENIKETNDYIDDRFENIFRIIRRSTISNVFTLEFSKVLNCNSMSVFESLTNSYYEFKQMSKKLQEFQSKNPPINKVITEHKSNGEVIYYDKSMKEIPLNENNNTFRIGFHSNIEKSKGTKNMRDLLINYNIPFTIIQ